MKSRIGHLIKVRQALKIMVTEKEPLRLTDDKKTLADYSVKMDTHIILRDIGPQVGYRDVVCSVLVLSRFLYSSMPALL